MFHCYVVLFFSVTVILTLINLTALEMWTMPKSNNFGKLIRQNIIVS